MLIDVSDTPNKSEHDINFYRHCMHLILGPLYTLNTTETTEGLLWSSRKLHFFDTYFEPSEPPNCTGTMMSSYEDVFRTLCVCVRGLVG